LIDNLLRYTCLLPASYPFPFHCIITALINAVVMQWNTINNGKGSALV